MTPKTWMVIGAAIIAATGSSWMSFKVGRLSGTADDFIIPDRRLFTLFGAAPNRQLYFQGTWALDGPDKIAFEKQVVKFSCHELDATCQAARAIVHSNALTVDTTNYDAKWQNNRVELSPYETPGDCRTETIVVDLISQDVISYTKNGTAPSPDCTKLLPTIGKPRAARLIDGWEKYFDDRYPDRRK